ncbi:hypothetical protein AEGHOMDF_5206 [Methylobacterium soli]|nr:hypothetical protein AEGHOMDF_5206 [Methylobacterium soli]
MGDGGLRLAAPLLPGSALQPVEADGVGLGAVAPDPVGLGHRHHQGVVPGKAQAQGIPALALREAQPLQSLEDAEAVVAVDGDVADPQVDLAHGQDRGDRPDGGVAALPEEVGRRDRRDVALGQAEARIEGRLDRHDGTGLGREHRRPVGHAPHVALGRLLGLPDEAAQSRRRTRQENAVLGRQPLAQAAREGEIRPPVAREDRDRRGFARILARGRDAALGDLRGPGRGVEIEAILARLAAGGGDGRLLSVGDLLEEGGGPLLRAGLHHEAGLGLIIQGARETRVELRQPVLLAAEGHEARGGIRRQDDLGGGVDDQHRHLRDRALRDRVVGADRGDAGLVVLDPAGAGGGRREDVDHPAAQGDLAGLVDPVILDIAEAPQLGDDPAWVDRVADAQFEMGPGPDLGRRHALDQGGRRRQHEVGPGRVVGEPAQNTAAGPHHPAGGRGPVVGQAIPFGVDRDAALGRQRAQQGGETFEAAVVAGNVDQGTGGAFEVEERDREGAEGHARRDRLGRHVRVRLLLPFGQWGLRATTI